MHNVCSCELNHFSCVQLFVILWTVACQAPLLMGFSRQGYWSGLPCPPPGDLPDPGITSASPVSPELQADSLHWVTGEAAVYPQSLKIQDSYYNIVYLYQLIISIILAVCLLHSKYLCRFLEIRQQPNWIQPLPSWYRHSRTSETYVKWCQKLQQEKGNNKCT